MGKNKVNGKDLRVWVGDTVVAMAKNCTFTANAETEDSTTKDDEGNVKKDDFVGYSWELQTDGLVPLNYEDVTGNDPVDLLDSLITGELVKVDFKQTGATGTAISISGTALVTQYELGASVGQKATYKSTFKGQTEVTNLSREVTQ